ncbi:hypothetical protein ACFST9_14340 [Hymenobacter monticola]|uniref:Uncharacterized protein n=1 Tax=Hymenobacter monticola TaxID=1705399 RepID=A0ABY4BEK8_9BACT|nr:hypothetical protein [Hymenobacter monticola]UOE36707.1 hypothetical protein MTP16_24780 [Hymenobacter monticola]
MPTVDQEEYQSHEGRAHHLARAQPLDYAALLRDTLALAKWKLTSHDVYMVHIKHIYRAKNPAGALQRSAFDFDYFPKRDSLVLVANNPTYTDGPTAP